MNFKKNRMKMIKLLTYLIAQEFPFSKAKILICGFSVLECGNTVFENVFR